MNRIQEAIARARDAREALLAGTALAAVEPEPDAAPPHAPVDAWADLPLRPVDPSVLAERRIVAAGDGPEAAPFHVMRTKLVRLAREKGWRRVAVTSPTPGCGKSTVSANLAYSFSRQPGTRTILCEMDFRRPSLAAMLDLPAGHRVSRVLRGRAPFADHAVRLAEGLAVATSSGAVRDPAEMFHAPETADALARIEAEHAPGMMLFDLPPMRVGDDVLALAPRMDAVLLVAASEVTSVAQIDACERELAEHCEVAGVILNKCHHQGGAYGYGDDGYY